MFIEFVSLRFPSAEEMTAFNQKEYDIIACVQQSLVRIEDVDPMALFIQDAKEALQSVSDRF